MPLSSGLKEFQAHCRVEKINDRAKDNIGYADKIPRKCKKKLHPSGKASFGKEVRKLIIDGSKLKGVRR